MCIYSNSVLLSFIISFFFYILQFIYFFFYLWRWDSKWWRQRLPTAGVWTLWWNTLSNPNSWGRCWPHRTGTGCSPGSRTFERSATGCEISASLKIHQKEYVSNRRNFLYKSSGITCFTETIFFFISFGDKSLKFIIKILIFFFFSFLVFYQNWRSGWSQTSCHSPCVISLPATVSASEWCMCPTSPTSPTRMQPTRDSCKNAQVPNYYIYLLYMQQLHSDSWL